MNKPSLDAKFHILDEFNDALLYGDVNNFWRSKRRNDQNIKALKKNYLKSSMFRII